MEQLNSVFMEAVNTVKQISLKSGLSGILISFFFFFSYLILYFPD